MDFSKLETPKVLILGAGASKGALIEKTVPPPVDYDFFETAKSISDRGTNIVAEKVLEFIFSLYGRTEGVGLEIVYRDIETREMINRIAPPSHNPLRWDRRKILLEDLIRRVYIQTTCDDKHISKPYKSLILNRILSILTKNDNIITFNYDLLVEGNISEKLWNPCSGYGAIVNGTKKDWCRNWLKERKVKRITKSKVLLLKPHGSINWRINPQNKRISLKSRPYTVRAGIAERITILAPGWKKPIEEKPFNGIWKKMRQKLDLCKTIIIVGYSLPETDLSAVSLFQEVIRNRTIRKHFLKNLILVDPNANIKERYVKMFSTVLGSKGKIKYYESVAKLNDDLFLNNGTKKS